MIVDLTAYSKPASAGSVGFAGAAGVGLEGAWEAVAEGEASAACGDGVVGETAGELVLFASGVAGAGTTCLTAAGADVGFATATGPSFSFVGSSGELLTGATDRLACVGA